MTSTSFRYKAMIGVGGIGTGRFFGLTGNHTLGREESRSGLFLDRRDYCKLHIVSHYVHTILGPAFHTLMVGKLGNDEWGRSLHEELRLTGFDLRYVHFSPGDQTLFGLCLVYPDGSGGNIMTADSACAKVDSIFVRQVEPEFKRYENQGIALAVPEVPLTSRLSLLQLATQHQFFRAASLTAEEIRSTTAAQIIAITDLLAINISEAAALTEETEQNRPPIGIVEKAVQVLTGINKKIHLSITAGRHGSWFWDGEQLDHLPALQVEVASTAGAGDAHLSGILIGLSAGLSTAGTRELARLIAAHSLTSMHTINPHTNRNTLIRFANTCQPDLADEVVDFLNAD
jgi:ribokinase